MVTIFHWEPGFSNLLESKQALELEPVAYRTSIGRLEFLWLGPAGFVLGPMAGTSPYLDWFNEIFYTHPMPWRQ